MTNTMLSPEESRRLIQRHLEWVANGFDGDGPIDLIESRLDLRGADLSGLELLSLVAPEADFGGANLDGTLLYDGYLPGCNFSGATMNGAGIAKDTLDQGVFTDVVGHGINGVRCEVWEGDFTGADLRESDFFRAFLHESTMVNVNLSGCRLQGTGLSGVDLSGADLTDADLTDAYLDGARLVGAHLAGATGLDTVRFLDRDGNHRGIDVGDHRPQWLLGDDAIAWLTARG